MLFDFYGTLARAVSWGDTHGEVFARHGLAFDAERWGWNFVGESNDGDEHLAHSVDRDAYVAWERERLRRRARNCGVGHDELEALVDDAIAAAPDAWERYLAGNAKVAGAIVGAVMKETKGRADARAVTALLEQKAAASRD